MLRNAAGPVLAGLVLGSAAACTPAQGTAACPAGQHWVAVHGSWTCSSGPDPLTGACPAGEVTVFAPGKPEECK